MLHSRAAPSLCIYLPVEVTAELNVTEQLVHELGVDGIVHCICVSSNETTTQAVFSFPTFTKISVLYFDPVTIDGISFKANKPRPVYKN